VSEKVVETVDQLLQSADDLAAAVAQNGVHGLRAALKKLAFEMKTDIADALVDLAKSGQQ
jgi:enoyl-CoA hydratase/carnithine racemase